MPFWRFFNFFTFFANISHDLSMFQQKNCWCFRLKILKLFSFFCLECCPGKKSFYLHTQRHCEVGREQSSCSCIFWVHLQAWQTNSLQQQILLPSHLIIFFDTENMLFWRFFNFFNFFGHFFIIQQISCCFLLLFHTAIFLSFSC